MRPTLSLSMIVKDAASHVGRCLASALPHVDELVVVDTGSSDDTEREVCRAAARFPAVRLRLGRFLPDDHASSFAIDSEEVMGPDLGPYTDRPMLSDFAAARQASLDLATSDYVMWLDADDELDGGEALPDLLEDMRASGSDMAELAYDYARDAAGHSRCSLSRERISLRAASSRWRSPVHEVLAPCSSPRFYASPTVVHRREAWGVAPAVAHRNLKILTLWARGRDLETADPRMLYYLGREEIPVRPDLAVEHLRLAASRSGWDEERACSRSLVAQLLEDRGDIDAALSEHAIAAAECPGRPDGILGMARVAHARGDHASCVQWTEAGLAAADRRSREHPGGIPCDPLDYSFRPLAPYASSLLAVRRPSDAEAACSAGLALFPADAALLALRQQALAAAKPPAATARDVLCSISRSSSLSAPPADIPPHVATVFAVELWKRHVAAGRHSSALALLDALPPEAVDAGRLAEARQATLRKLAGG